MWDFFFVCIPPAVVGAGGEREKRPPYSGSGSDGLRDMAETPSPPCFIPFFLFSPFDVPSQPAFSKIQEGICTILQAIALHCPPDGAFLPDPVTEPESLDVSPVFL